MADSMFDAMFGGLGAPNIMNYFASPGSITLRDGDGNVIVNGADASISAIETEDQFHLDGVVEAKVLRREATLVVDAASTYLGTDEQLTAGTATVTEYDPERSEDWDIERVERQSPSMITSGLKRDEARVAHRRGFRIE